MKGRVGEIEVLRVESDVRPIGLPLKDKVNVAVVDLPVAAPSDGVRSKLIDNSGSGGPHVGTS